MGWNHQPDWIVAPRPNNSDQKNHYNHRCCCRRGTIYCWWTYGEGGQPKSSPYPYPLSENLSPRGVPFDGWCTQFFFSRGDFLLSKEKGVCFLGSFSRWVEKSTWNLKITFLEQEKTSFSRWFKVTFWFPSWRSLNLSKWSLNHPQKGTKNCQALNYLILVFRAVDAIPPFIQRPWKSVGQALRTRATFSIISWGEAPGFFGEWSRNTTLRRCVML